MTRNRADNSYLRTTSVRAKNGKYKQALYLAGFKNNVPDDSFYTKPLPCFSKRLKKFC